jgi:hypothetical protein
MHQFFTLTLFIFLIQNVSAQEVKLIDFNYSLSDVSKAGQNSKKLFSEMDRKLIKVGESICSNRALVWNYDFKRHYNLKTGKIFLFYTKKNGDVGLNNWWYHVAPVINEKGQLIVMDAGFPGMFREPLKISEWLERFAKTENCKEMRAHQSELIELIFSGRQFPRKTSYGMNDCYTIIVPAEYWTPSAVAKNLLGRDQEGNPIRYIRDDFDMDELYQACVEAVTSPLGRVLGSGQARCEKYLNYSPLISNN